MQIAVEYFILRYNVVGLCLADSLLTQFLHFLSQEPANRMSAPLAISAQSTG